MITELWEDLVYELVTAKYLKYLNKELNSDLIGVVAHIFWTN